jgi:hypothetical protein
VVRIYTRIANNAAAMMMMSMAVIKTTESQIIFPRWYLCKYIERRWWTHDVG